MTPIPINFTLDADKTFGLAVSIAMSAITGFSTYLLSRRSSKIDIAAKIEVMANNALDREQRALDREVRLQAQLDKLQEQNNSLEEYVRAMRTSNGELLDEREKLRDELNRIHGELELLRRELTTEKERNVLLEQNHKKEMLEKEIRIQGLEATVLDYQRRLEEMKRKLATLERKSTGDLKR
jgi:chromosome segregation ATPase